MSQAESRRFAACIEYDGACYKGWQSQAGVRTVQDDLETALGQVANTFIRTTAAGRTDTGVHATGQVVHFDSPVCRSPDAWLRGGNTRLSDAASICWVQPVDAEFHARFSARRRRYRYVLLNQSRRPALFRQHVSWEYRPLRLEPMQAGAAHLLGTHDFSAYRASSCQSKNPVKTLTRIEVQQQGPWFWLDIEADGFLHHMVRNVMGVLIRIGRGEASPEWSRQVLESRDRRLGGVTAPPFGLYLTGIDYDSGFELPQSETRPVFW